MRPYLKKKKKITKGKIQGFVEESWWTQYTIGIKILQTLGKGGDLLNVQYIPI